MVQQINLYDETLRPRREGWRAAHGLWAVAGTLAVALGLSAALDARSVRRLAEGRQLAQQLAAERERLARPAAGDGADTLRARATEVERLRALDAGQRRVRAALEGQVTARQQGYTPYFLALSRQASPSVWITGLGIGGDGQALEIQGRMTDAALLPDYLRRLNAEPQFKGRSFATLNIKAADTHNDAAALAGYTEFVLRSQPSATESAR